MVIRFIRFLCDANCSLSESKNIFIISMIRVAERGQEGHFVPGPQGLKVLCLGLPGLRGLIIGDLRHFDYMKCFEMHLSQR